MATSGSFQTVKYSERYYKVEWKQNDTNKLQIDWTLSAEGVKLQSDGNYTTFWTFRELNFGVTVTNAKVSYTSSTVSPTSAKSSFGDGNTALYYNISNPSVTYKNTATNSLPDTTATLHSFPDNKSNGGNGGGPRPGVVLSGYFILSDITSSNVTLTFNITAGTAGYSRSADGNTAFSITIPTYTVSYNANGGSGAPSAQTKYYNTSLTLSSTKPTNVTTTKPTGTITISYDANGGSSTPSKGTGEYTNTKTVTYPFNNWNTNSSGTGTSYNAGASYTANASVTLYAKWNTASTTETRTTNPTIKTPDAISRSDGSTTGYTVTFDVNGGSGSHVAVTSDRTIKYEFDGWNTNASGTGTNYSASTAYTFIENDTLYAKWTPSYTNNAITLPTPTRTGYTPNGWYTAKSGGTKAGAAGGDYTPAANTTLYAQWTAITYKVKYDGNGYTSGSTSDSSHTYDVEKALTANGFKKTGYTFSGWNTKVDGTGTSYTDKKSVTNLASTSGATVTLYAQWEANEYSVTLNVNGATSTDHTKSVKVKYDSAMPSITKPSREYTVTYNANGGSCSTTSAKSTYTFKGYYTAASGGTPYYTSTGASARKWDKTSNITLYAQWASNLVTLPTPSRTGYKFLGWATNSDATSGTTGSYTPDSNVTLYAIWEALATMFVKNDGSYKAGTPYIKVGSQWKKANAVYVKVNGSWKLSTR